MDSALIEIDEDPNHAADHAIIRVAGAAGSLATARLRIRQANGAYLGPGGWQSGEAWIDADAKEARGADLVLYVGPWLCRQMRNQTYEFTVGAVLSVETWPRITAGFSGSSGVFSPLPQPPPPAPMPERKAPPLPPRPWPQPAAAPPPAEPVAPPPPEPPLPEPPPVIAPPVPGPGWRIIARRVLYALLFALVLIGAALAAIRWGGPRVAVPGPACGPGQGQACRTPSPTPPPTPTTGAGAPGRQHAPDARAGTSDQEKAQVPSIARGLADRIAFQAWVMLLDDDSRRGADWWAAHRMEYWHRSSGGDWVLDAGADSGAICRSTQPPASIAGCLDAIRRLTPTDRMRLHDTEYRNGWNSFPE
jgi:hypothetical protein